MTDDEIKHEVIAVLRSVAPKAGFQGADVRSGEDYDGESVIHVLARYETRPVERPDPLVAAVHAIRERLIGLGEERLVFLTNDVEAERMAEAEETA